MRLLRFLARIPRILEFMGFFLYELVLANLRVAWEVATPGFSMRAGIVAVPIETRTDLETTMLANFISLTPGTLSLDISEDRRTLFVHSLYVQSPESFRAGIAQLERHMLRAMR